MKKSLKSPRRFVSVTVMLFMFCLYSAGYISGHGCDRENRSGEIKTGVSPQGAGTVFSMFR